MQDDFAGKKQRKTEGSWESHDPSVVCMMQELCPGGIRELLQ